MFGVASDFIDEPFRTAIPVIVASLGMFGSVQWIVGELRSPVPLTTLS
jgi:hypothetical protein